MDILDEYEPVTKTGALLSKALITIWERLGKPEDCSTPAGWRMLDEIINVWAKFCPAEYEAWIHDRKIDLAYEMTLSQLSKKGGGYNPVTYPQTVFQMIKAILPNQKVHDKKFMHQLSLKYPIFMSTNLKI